MFGGPISFVLREMILLSLKECTVCLSNSVPICCLDPRLALNDCHKQKGAKTQMIPLFYQTDISGTFPLASREIHVDVFEIAVHNSNKEHVDQQIQRNSWPRATAEGKGISWSLVLNMT